MSELAPEAPASVTVSAEPGPAPVAEETALAAGAALSESGQAREEAAQAEAVAQAAAEAADQSRAEAAAAGSVAEQASAAALTADQKIDQLLAMVAPIADDYASRRAAEAEAASQEAEVAEVDATGTSGDSGGTPAPGGNAVPDSGHDDGAGTPARRRGLRRGRK